MHSPHLATRGHHLRAAGTHLASMGGGLAARVEEVKSLASRPPPIGTITGGGFSGVAWCGCSQGPRFLHGGGTVGLRAALRWQIIQSPQSGVRQLLQVPHLGARVNS